MRSMYRLFRLKNGDPHTLFHGVNGSRKIVADRWYQANERVVADGGSNSTQYLSGFHVMPTVADCMEYMKRFKNKSDLYVCRIYVGGAVREKSHSRANVYLAQSMMVTPQDWRYTLSCPNLQGSDNDHHQTKDIPMPKDGWQAIRARDFLRPV